MQTMIAGGRIRRGEDPSLSIDSVRRAADAAVGRMLRGEPLGMSRATLVAIVMALDCEPIDTTGETVTP